MTTYSKVYPPYQLNTFQECPVKWDYGKRWKPQPGQNSAAMLLAGMLGNALSVGLAEFLSSTEEEPVRRGRACDLAVEYALSHWTPEMTSKSKIQAGTMAVGATNIGTKTLLPLKEILAVEQFVGRVIRPDVVGRDFEGNLAVLDHKFKANLDDRYFDKELRRYNNSNQFLEYAWLVGQEYGEPVDKVYVHIVILAPLPQTIIHPVDTSHKRQAHWLKGATRDWIDMHNIESLAVPAQPRYTACEGQYGPCHFNDACHVLHGDESTFAAAGYEVTR